MNRDRARSLRNNATEPEKRLWDRLRGWRKDGFPVRRQVPIGPYIVDFACHSCRVVVELDGGQHNSVEGRRSDAERDAWLEANGYRVLRFWNSDLQANLPEVLESIRRVLVERHPHPGR
ncbi:MAG TPA: DNA methyltransferase, partial [Alphaproteobacteria bacterium]|nr:DNA methyltransferase [Alphaproteobacteria bacterium]